MDTTLKTFGQLDILVNNASMQEDKKESFIGLLLFCKASQFLGGLGLC